MGARNNVILHFSSGAPIYVYGHWIGDEWPIKQALEASRPRWGDEAYSARIIIQTILPPLDQSRSPLGSGDITGYGITPYECDQDGGYQQVNIHLEDMIVEIGHHEWTFEQYLQQGVAR